MPSNTSAERQAVAGEKFSDKAKVLLDLFGPNGVERLAKAGLDPKLTFALRSAVKGVSSGEASREDRNGLLEKFRDLGFLADDKEVAPVVEKPEPTVKKAPPANLASKIADNLDERNLGEEHPAVIAYILKSQPRDVQKRVLLALDGNAARATMRFLKS